MSHLLEASREIVQQATADYSPYAVVLMLSGGKDSMLAYQVARRLGIKIDFIMHGRTGTGIPQTTDFVRSFAADSGVPYIEADADTAYEDYVLRKGFFGKGMQAHSFAYHTLKIGPFRKAISRHIRQGQRNRPVLLLNGARIAESANRAANMKTPVRCDPAQKGNVWVNIAHYFSQSERDGFLKECKAPINDVTAKLCRSGECLCGTTQDVGDRNEAGFFYPDWKRWLDDLENRVYERGFAWGWGENQPKSYALEKAGQQRLFEPMCSSCKVL